MKKIVIIIFMVSVFNIPLHLKAAPIYGFYNCGFYLEIYDEGGYKWNDVSTLMVYWVQGFISGFNSVAETANVGDALSVPEDNDGIKYALLKHCKENPLDNIQDAMFDEIFPTLEYD